MRPPNLRPLMRANLPPIARFQLLHGKTVALVFNLACIELLGLDQYRSCDPYFSDDKEILLEMFPDSRGKRSVMVSGGPTQRRVCVTKLLRQEDVKFSFKRRYEVRKLDHWFFVNLAESAEKDGKQGER